MYKNLRVKFYCNFWCERGMKERPNVLLLYMICTLGINWPLLTVWSLLFNWEITKWAFCLFVFGSKYPLHFSFEEEPLIIFNWTLLFKSVIMSGRLFLDPFLELNFHHNWWFLLILRLLKIIMKINCCSLGFCLKISF